MVRVGVVVALLLAALAVPVSGQTVTPIPTVPPPAITPLRLPGTAQPILPNPTALPDNAGDTAPLATPTTPPIAIIPAITPLASRTPESAFPIRPGTVEGALNDAVPIIRYRFDAQANDSIALRMEPTSGTLDPVLTLLDANGALIARNDDAASGDRSAELDLTLTTGGAYTVIAASFGPAAGTFRLVLTIAGDSAAPPPVDPISQPPPFGVAYTIIDFQEFTPGAFAADAPPAYYAIAGQRGDLVRAILTRTSGDLLPALRLLNSDSEPISREGGSREDEAVAFITLPATGWYLVEAASLGGAGSYDLYVNRIAATELTVGSSLDGTFLPNGQGTSYLVNARIGDVLTFNMFMTDLTGGGQPAITLYDISLREIASASGQRFATLRATAPRSAPYIVQVDNAVPGTFGTYALRYTRIPQELDDLTPINVRYNEDYSGTITPDAPLTFYRFTGKVDELVTLTLTAAEGDLDPYLILLDSDLNELAVNDDGGGGGAARIVQFRLPKDGDYLIIAARSGLGLGTTSGGYRLTITAGAITLQAGALTATLAWTGLADLNLFVRDPSGQPVSWSAPSARSGGLLQIDSNTACETLSAQPIEHIYWPQIVPGDYEVWVWAQNRCTDSADATAFTLTLTAGGTALPPITGDLQAGQRYETRLRLTAAGIAALLDAGVVTRPTAQQQASEGGDLPIAYGEAVTNAITNDRYAVFYQFEGRAGEVVVISAERVTGDLDPMLALLDASSAPLPGASNDDADASTRDSRLTYTLPTDGRYSIAVTRYGVRDGTTTGDFRLTIGRG